MDGQSVFHWTRSLTAQTLRASQAKTLAWIVASLVHVRHLNLPELAVHATSKTTFKHRLKRLSRFLGNDRIDPVAASRRCYLNCSNTTKRNLSCSPSTGPSFVRSTRWDWSPCSGDAVCQCCGSPSRSMAFTNRKRGSKKKCSVNSSPFYLPVSGSSFWLTGISAKPIWHGIASIWDWTT